MSREEKKQEPDPITKKEQEPGAITIIYQLPKSVGIAVASNGSITTSIDIEELQ